METALLAILVALIQLPVLFCKGLVLLVITAAATVSAKLAKKDTNAQEDQTNCLVSLGPIKAMYK